MSRVADPLPLFNRYSGQVIKWVNPYGAVRYQPAIYLETHDDTDQRFLFEYKYDWDGRYREWLNEDHVSTPAPVLYRSRRRAKRKAWSAVVKREQRQWTKA